MARSQVVHTLLAALLQTTGALSRLAAGPPAGWADRTNEAISYLTVSPPAFCPARHANERPRRGREEGKWGLRSTE